MPAVGLFLLKDMKCCFFGHADFNYMPYEQTLIAIITDLIVNQNVHVFYSGGRGNFDMTCARLVAELCHKYPHIENVKFLSYLPTGVATASTHPLYYTGTEFLLEKYVIPKYAIIETNKCVIDACDFVVSGVTRNYGGAQQAVKYAKRQKKHIIDIFNTEN